MTTPATRDSTVRYPLVVVDWAADRDRFESGWLRLVGPADLPGLPLTDTCQSWDGNGKPVTITGTAVRITSEAPDPAVRTILQDWRRRAPLPVLPSAGSGDTALPFIVDDVAVASGRLTETGTTRRPSTALRVLPVVLMVLSALALVPGALVDALPVVVALAGYMVSSALMRRWSYPPSHWGEESHRDPHDGISRLAVGAKVLFWAAAAGLMTAALLDWAGVLPNAVPWA